MLNLELKQLRIKKIKRNNLQNNRIYLFLIHKIKYNSLVNKTVGIIKQVIIALSIHFRK